MIPAAAAAGWSAVCPARTRTTRLLEGTAEVGGVRSSRSSSTRYTTNPWTSRKSGRGNVIIVAMSNENDSQNKSSGHFAGLSSLKEQLLIGREGSSRGLPATTKQRRTPPEKKKVREAATPAPAPPSIVQKNANANAHGKEPVALLVSNLPKELTKAEYESLMQQFPQVSHCTYLTHRSGHCRSYGFCELRPGADVTAVIEILNRQTVGGRLLKASIATGKKESDTHAQPEAGASIHDQVTPRISIPDVQTKATTTVVKNLRATPKLRDERKRDGGAKSLGGTSNQSSGGIQSQQQLGTVTRLHRTGTERSNPPNWASSAKRAQSRSGSNAVPLSGQKVLDALERFAKQRKAIRETPGSRRVSSEFKVETDDTDETEPEPVQVRPDWLERIKSLEARIQRLKRS